MVDRWCAVHAGLWWRTSYRFSLRKCAAGIGRGMGHVTMDRKSRIFISGSSSPLQSRVRGHCITI